MQKNMHKKLLNMQIKHAEKQAINCHFSHFFLHFLPIAKYKSSNWCWNTYCYLYNGDFCIFWTQKGDLNFECTYHMCHKLKFFNVDAWQALPTLVWKKWRKPCKQIILIKIFFSNPKFPGKFKKLQFLIGKVQFFGQKWQNMQINMQIN